MAHRDEAYQAACRAPQQVADPILDDHLALTSPRKARLFELGGIPESAVLGFCSDRHDSDGERAAMARPIEVSRKDHAPAAVLEGHSRGEAAHLNGMQRQTLRDWVHRYNEHGVAGLISRQSPGRPSALSEEQMEELRQMVLAGPELERHGVVRWRCADLRKEIAARWSVVVHENTVGRFLHRLEMTRLQPRPQHPKTDAAAQEDFKKNFARLVAEALPETASGKPIEIWFQDEARVGQQGSLEYIWAPVGSRPRMVRDNRHDSAYLFGAICHRRQVGAAIIMPAANTEAMNEHLAEIATQVAPGAHAVLVCDRAGWHQKGRQWHRR
jgi:transposase